MTEFLRENYAGILKQERGLADTIVNVPRNNKDIFDDVRLVVLLGAGDSYAVAEYGKWAFLSLGIDAISVSSTEIQYVELDDECLVIGVTASGRSLSTIESLDVAKNKDATTIALTDNPKGTANEHVDHVWLTKSGVETYNISPSAPTTCAMAYLLKMAEMLQTIPESKIHNDIHSLLRNGPDILNWAKNVGPVIAEIPAKGKPIYLISNGPNYVAAQLGMMKFNEYSLIKGIATLKEEFQHHSVLSINENERAVVISDSPISESEGDYLNVMRNKLEMQVFHLYTPEELHLESALGQAIANTIALQVAAYLHVKKNDPEKERFIMPHAEAFRIY